MRCERLVWVSGSLFALNDRSLGSRAVVMPKVSRFGGQLRKNFTASASGGFVRNSETGTPKFAALWMNVRFSFCGADNRCVKSLLRPRRVKMEHFRFGLRVAIRCAAAHAGSMCDRFRSICGRWISNPDWAVLAANDFLRFDF